MRNSWKTLNCWILNVGSERMIVERVVAGHPRHKIVGEGQAGLVIRQRDRVVVGEHELVVRVVRVPVINRVSIVTLIRD